MPTFSHQPHHTPRTKGLQLKKKKVLCNGHLKIWVVYTYINDIA